ncbi:hypothetical protein SteCoe_22094 [Stentor coeruleus]|uniref:Anaphase-promoting complex subunit 4 WD40 domain-containing protein n=1 Tax=Stentor coeruleus TaxID=5963 RepID=A0A1R2BN86_9CILI|nr:hypothetical protein SteCoe_22094 [Stentor coeruleus]
MSKNEIAACLLNRELGDTQSFNILEANKYWSSDMLIKKATIPTFHQSASLIWISGRLNLIVTLDSRGRVVCYDAFRDYKSLCLTSPSEHVCKCLFTESDLVLIQKSSDNNSIFFIRLSLADLQADKVQKIRILEDIKICLDNFIEFNEKSSTVFFEANGSLQVWSLQENCLLHSFPKSPDLKFAYSSGCLIYWQKNANMTSIGVINPITHSCKQLSLVSDNEVCLCDIVQDQLVVCMNGCHLQIIDLNTCQTRYLKKGTPKQYFQMTNCEASVGIFNDGTGVIISKELREFRAINKGYWFADLFGKSILCSAQGMEIIIDGEVHGINFSPKKIQQIGCNPDTQDIYIAEKGVIHVID